MEKISVIKKVKYVKGWEGKEDTLFFHEITLQNGDEGKLEGNSEESPVWLCIDSTIRYSIRSGPRGMLIKVLGVINGNQQYDAPQNNTPQRKNNQEQPDAKKSNFGSRLDSDTAFRLRQQKCISLTTCLDRANELVIAGKIEYTGKHAEALSDFKFIMKHSGISEMEQEPSSEREAVGPSLEVKSQPSTFPLQPQPILFPPDATSAPLSPFIQEIIARCGTTKQLSNLKTQLHPDEIDNKNIQLAIKNKLAEIKSKNK